MLATDQQPTRRIKDQFVRAIILVKDGCTIDTRLSPLSIRIY